MTVRRALVPAVIVIGFLAGVLASQHTEASTTTRFGAAPFAARPFASKQSPITTTWYCAGVPAVDDTVGGEVVIANPTDVPINGHITYMSTDGAAAVVQPIIAPPRDKLTLDVPAAMRGDYVSAVVELVGGEGLVEQRALFPAGDAVSSCITQASSTWYFADGWTADGSTDQLVITNPYEDSVSMDVAFYDKNGAKRTPGPLQGDSIDAQSVKTIDIGSSGLADEQIIGVEVVATRGRLIVSRAQHYVGGGRLGYTLNLGAPTPSEQLWFAYGDNEGADIVEQYVLFNPTDTDAEATITVLGLPQSDTFVAPESIPVPAGEVVTYDTNQITGLPEGPHSMVFSTADSASSLVVERVVTETVDDQPSTSVVMAMTSEFAFATRWYLPIGVDEADADAIVVYNPFASPATIALKAVGPGGEVAVPGMDAIELPGAGIRVIPLTDPSVFGKIVVVEATAGIYVERRLPRGADLTGRSGSWALPEECETCNFSSPPSS